MSHHGQDLEKLSPFFRDLRDHFEKIKGEYPDGKLTEADEGALSFAVSSMGEKVVIAFGEPTAWLGMTGDQAAELAILLIRHAREAGITKPLTIPL